MASHPALVEQFLSQECTPHVRKLICEASTTSKVRHEFQFNRFNLLLDLEAGRATITDELDVSPDGSLDLGLDAFLSAIGCDGASS